MGLGLAAGAVCLSLTACKSAFINASVVNQTGGTVSELEVSYPSASFGTNEIAPGATYLYHFELIGNGPIKASWTDAAKKPHQSTGPTVVEGTRGTLRITLQADGTAAWQPDLKR